MSRYYRRRTKSRREKIGFYAAFSICLIAVCMAVYSTYNTVTEPKTAPVSASATGVVAVNEPVTSVTVPVPTLGMTPIREETLPTATSEPDTLPETTQEETTQCETTQGREDALETMLAADVSLALPTKSGHVLREFSRDSVYNKTLNTWKPHTGADFDGELGEDVFAMLGGEVTKVSDDKLYGKTVEISVNNVTVGYSGLGAVKVERGDKVNKGDKIATIGTVPAEAGDKNHIHVYVKVNNSYADPLSFIDNND